MPSPSEVDAYQALISQISGLAIEKVAALIATAPTQETLLEAYPEVLAPYLGAAGRVSAEWYQSLAPDAPFEVVEAPLVAREALRANARWGVTQLDPATALSGSAGRQVFNSARQTVITNTASEGVRYARHAQPNACGFCRMLATRTGKWLYRSKEAAETVVGRSTNLSPADRRMVEGGLMSREEALNRREQQEQAYVRKSLKGSPRARRPRGSRSLGEKYHDHCRCVAVPIRAGNSYTPPDYVQQWEQDYIEAYSQESGTKDIINHMRRDDYARNKDTINAQQRKWYRERKARNQPDVESFEDIVDLDAPTATPEAPVDELSATLAAAEDAMAAGDFDRADELLGKAEKLERKQAAAAAREAKAAAAEQAKVDRVIALVEDGWDAAEAESEVYGISVEKVRRRDFIAKMRSEHYEGAGFDALVTVKYREMVEAQWLAAEKATNGYMVKAMYEGSFDPRRLWTVNEATARKVMSDEMAAWFDEHGRITRAAYRQSILDGHGTFAAATEDFLQ